LHRHRYGNFDLLFQHFIKINAPICKIQLINQLNYELELYSLQLPVAKFCGLNDQVVGSEFDQQIIIHSYEKYYKVSWD